MTKITKYLKFSIFNFVDLNSFFWEITKNEFRRSSQDEVERQNDA